MNHVTQQVQLAHGMQAGRINMGKAHFDASDSDWTLLDQPEDRHQPRRYRKSVNFDVPFGTVPHIHLGLTSLDSYQQFNQRISVDVVEVDQHSFTIEAMVWWDSKVWACSANWLAIPLV